MAFSITGNRHVPWRCNPLRFWEAGLRAGGGAGGDDGVWVSGVLLSKSDGEVWVERRTGWGASGHLLPLKSNPRKIKPFQYAHYRTRIRSSMDSRDCLFSSAERTSELILSVTLVSNGHWFLLNEQYFWLVMTDKRIIFFNTDDILTASGKSPAELTLHDRIRRLVIPEETSTATREKIRAMHPSAIAAAFPGAVIIPVSAVASFVIDQGYWDLLSERYSRWTVNITGQDNTGRNTMFRFLVRCAPGEIVSTAKDLFGKRFVAPKKIYFGWKGYEV
jgi:hypothetical protein